MIRRRLAAATSAVIAVAAAMMLTGCAGGATAADTAGASADDPILIGVVNAEEPYRAVFADAARAEGIFIEFVNFSEFPLINQALADGDLHLNQFQHLQFLANFNVATDNALVPIGATAVYPLGLYSLRHTSLDEFPDGAEIAIPNDPTNQARALLVLQDAGLITLRDGGSSFSVPQDIVAEESRASVIPVEAAMTATALQDVDGSIVNNSMIVQVGKGLQDAIFHDDPASVAAEPYINVFAARPEEADNPTFARLVEIFHGTPAVIEGLIESSAGTASVRTNSREDLERILAGIQANHGKAPNGWGTAGEPECNPSAPRQVQHRPLRCSRCRQVTSCSLRKCRSEALSPSHNAGDPSINPRHRTPGRPLPRPRTRSQDPGRSRPAESPTWRFPTNPWRRPVGKGAPGRRQGSPILVSG